MDRRAEVSEQGQRRNLERPPRPEPLPVAVVDNHCHLDVADGRTDLPPELAIAEAAAVGVTRIVQVGCDVASSRWAVAAAERFPSVVAAVAVHPNDAAQPGTDLPAALAAIEALAAHPHVRAVGETGMDRFRTRDEAGIARQRESFAAHIALAHAYGRTLVIHDRDAHADILDVLDAEGVPERVVMHCFSGDADFARACLDRGAYLSFAGTVTFGNAQPLRDALAIAPRNQILVETDAPYLTPTPFRGRPNASYLVPHTVRAMAEVRGDDLADLCTAIAANTDAAFGGAWEQCPTEATDGAR
ncbi:MAG: TatD family hydrolase [Propionibacteriaceae bacterium]